MSPDCRKFVRWFNGECLRVEQLRIANCRMITAESIAAIAHDNLQFFGIRGDVKLNFYRVNILSAIGALEFLGCVDFLAIDVKDEIAAAAVSTFGRVLLI